MTSDKRTLIALNVVGGIAVLGSYAWGALGQPAAMDALWGGVPESARGIYTVNMFLSAFGYMLFTPYIVFRWLDGARTSLVAAAYAAILIPSALWLPLTAWLVASPGAAVWWLVRLDLALVALGSAGLLVMLLRSGADRRMKGHAFAVLGLLPFCLQTVVLDAIVWPLYYPKTWS